MPRRTCALMSIAFALSLFSATGAATTAKRTFVASTGNDANPCSIAAPCRGFTRAITQTSASGEVIVLDSAGYGAVTITQSVSIIAPAGIYAGISVFSGDGVTVNSPTATVVLRGLTINGQGGSSVHGIDVVVAQEVHVDSVIVSNMGQSGIIIHSNASLTIKDSIFRHNGGDGISIIAGTVTAENVRSERNTLRGLYIQGGSATVGSSFFNQNASSGVRADGGVLTMLATMIENNDSDGVFNNGAGVFIEACSIDQNGSHGVETKFIAASSLFSGVTTVSHSHINANGLISPGNGTYSNNEGGYIFLTDVSAQRNSLYDINYTFCCTITYGNNAFETKIGTLGDLISSTLR